MANLDKTITIRFRGDTIEFNNSVDNINRMLRTLNNEVTKINKQIKLDPSNPKNYADKITYLNEKIGLAEEALKNYRAELKPYQDMIEKGEVLNDKEVKEFERLQRAISETEKRLSSYNNELNKTQFTLDNLARLNLSKAFTNAGDQLIKQGRAVMQVADAFRGVSLAAGGTLAGMAKAAIDFEDALSNVRKVMKDADFNSGYFDVLKDDILAMSERMPTTANEIAQVVANALQLGVASKDASKFAETMIKLGTSTNINADEASIAIARFYNIMAEDLDTVDRFGASLVALGNNFPTFESEIMEMATRIASTGKTMGLTSQEILGLATAMSSVGLKAENGGSAISTVFQNISKVIGVNTKANAKKLGAFAELLGITGAEFKQAWNEDAFGTFAKIVMKLGEAGEKGENLSAILSSLGINNIRQIDTMLRLAGATDVFSEALTISTQAWEENTALNEEASRKYQTIAAQLKILKNRLLAVGAELGEALLPYIRKFTDFVGRLLTKIRDLSPETKDLIVKILGLTAVLHPALKAIGGLEVGIGSLFKGIGSLLNKTYPGDIVKFGDAFKTLGNSIKAFTGKKVFNLKFDNFSGLQKMAGGIKTVFSTIGQAIYSLPTKLMNGTLFSGISSGISGLLNAIKGTATSAWANFAAGFQKLGNGIKTFAKGGFNVILHPLQSLKAGLLGAGKSFTSFANSITAGGVAGGVLGLLGALALSFKLAYDNSEKMRNTVAAFVYLVKSSFNSAFTAVKGVIADVFGYLQATAMPIIEQIKSIFETQILPVLVDLWSTILPILYTVIRDIFNVIVSIVTWLGEKLKPVIDIVARIIQEIVIPIGAVLIEVLANIIKNLAKIFGWLWETIKPILEPIAKLLNDVFTFAWQLLLDVINGLLDAFQWLLDKLALLWEWLKDTGVIEGFKNAFDGVKNTISGIVGFIGDCITKADELIRKISGIDTKKLNVGAAVRGAISGTSATSKTQTNNITINTKSSRITNNDLAVLDGALGKGVFGF